MKVLKVFLLIGLLLLILTACTPEGELLPELQEPISVFIQSLIELLLVPLLMMGIAWVYAKVRELWRNFSTRNPQEAYWINYVISTVVQAAEQVYESNPEAINDKKAWALARAEAWFGNLGIQLEIEEISDLIEAEVKALFNSQPVILPEENQG